VDYGFVDRSSNSGASKSFHTRQITFPILFTVYHTFEPHSLDLIRFDKGKRDGDLSAKRSPTSIPPTPRRTSFAVTADDELQRRMEEEANDRHCLVSLSVRNVFGVPFEVTLARKGDGPGQSSCLQYENIADDADDVLATSRLIPPGSTEK
jgi:hypothetical protein